MARAPRLAADDSSRIAVGLIRGLAATPCGRGRTKECSARRQEVRRGLEQVRAALDRLEDELLAECEFEPQRHAGCLRWASQLLTGLHTATRTLRTLDSCGGGASECEYEGLLEAIGDLRTRLAAAAAAAAETSPTAVAEKLGKARQFRQPEVQVQVQVQPEPPRRTAAGATVRKARSLVSKGILAGAFTRLVTCSAERQKATPDYRHTSVKEEPGSSLAVLKNTGTSSSTLTSAGHGTGLDSDFDTASEGPAP